MIRILILLGLLSVSCPIPEPGEPWDHYNHPEWYIVRTGTVTTWEPCYFTLLFPEGDSIRLLGGDTMELFVPQQGRILEVEYRLSTLQLGYFKVFDNTPIPTPSPTPTPLPSPSPSPTPCDKRLPNGRCKKGCVCH